MQGSMDSTTEDFTTVTLDVAKLQSTPEDQQEIFVMSFLRDLEKIVLRLDETDASAYQFYVKKELFRVLTLTAPSPTRVIRNQIGRCFAQIFKLGDRKLLFETLNELLNMVNTSTGKTEKDLRGRHAAVHLIGEVFEVAGDSAIMTCTITCSSLLKLVKTAQNHCGLRGAIFKTLGKIFKLVGGSADETIARDVWKQARNVATSDKATIVQGSAIQCLEILMKDTPYFSNQTDYDKMMQVILKLMESSSSTVRKAAASCWASALVGAHGREQPNPFVKALRKGAKKPVKRLSIISAVEDEEMEVPVSPITKKQAPVLSFTLEEILKQLSIHYTKASVSSKVRAGIAQCYIDILTRLGSTVVEGNYGVILNHFLVELLSNPAIGVNRFRLLMTRKYVKTILEDVVGERLLGETGQLNALRTIFNDIIKNYPQVIKDRPELNKHTLAGALHTAASLIRLLGATVTSVQDLIRDGLLQVLQHPSYTVQVGTSWALKSFVLAVPAQLLPIITICMNNVNRELSLLTTQKSLNSNLFRRCTGFANGLAAVISTAPLQPLYASVDVTSRVLSLATSLLKSSGDHDLRVSSTQIQVAWILIGGLMSLGPNFVKIHLSQLLLLWKNALPKPLAKDANLDRSLLELSFLSHVRECALGSILAFLEFNSKLLTTDVSKRISAMLQNSTLFLNTLPQKKTTDDVTQRLLPSIQLVDYDLMVRRRVLQCYNKLVKLSHAEALQANLLTIAVTFFADPEKYTPSSLSTAIASSAGTFENVWEIGDNYGYGVCDFVRGYDVGVFEFESQQDSKPTVSNWMMRTSPSAQIDEVLYTPVLGSLEHDSVALYITGNSPAMVDPTPAPPATAVVNSAIDLFTILLPMQQPKVQESILEQLATFLASKSLDRDPGRKAAITVNVAVAILGALKLAMDGQIPSANLSTPSVQKIMQEILRDFLIHPDPYVRNVAYEALGRLCSVSGNAFTGNEINYLINTIVSNRDPNARAGCAVALGCIHTYVGGMAAGFHLKTIVGILMSLANDPHPAVHFWALEGLARVIDSAGLTFSGYVTSTLGILARLYVADTHDIEVSSIANSNLEIELPTINIIARCIQTLIGVLGPDLQDMSKARDLILTLIGQFLQEADHTVVLEGLRCLEHMSLFAASYVDISGYVRRAQKELASPEWELRDVAVEGLYQLMKGDASRIVTLAEPGLEDDLWFALNIAPTHEGIRKIIRNWVAQTALNDPKVWVDRCQMIMTKTFDRRSEKEKAKANTAASGPGSAGMELNDEEAASFAAAAVAPGEKPTTQGTQEHLRWQVRTFAMVCLSDLLSIVGEEILANPSSITERRIVEKIGEVIKMAFSASTSNVVELRLCGLKIIEQVLKMFGHTPDPDFVEATLLEQYQAQISSALTPAFAADSSPELASEAVNVCGGFIATGIVKDVERMGRILKLLISALETFSSDTDTVIIGDLKGLSSNAQVMVKMAVLSAWAELQVASVEQTYLVDVVKPHIRTLAPLWLSSLRDFARLRFEPDISSSVGGATTSLSGSIDAVYSALNRETLLKFYQDSWLKIVDAIASLIEEDSHFVFEALDGKAAASEDTPGVGHDINYRDEPVAFFFVLFGIAFEALVGRPGEGLATKEQTLAILLALKKILHPSVCGYAVYQEVIFSETMDLLDRLVLTEGVPVQLAIVDIARGLCVGHPTARNRSKEGENLTEDIDQLFELTRIIVLVLAGILPNLVDTKTPARNTLSEESVNLIKVSLDALVDAAEVFPSVIRMDLYASILHIFTTLLGTTICQAEVVPRSLPIFKRFITIITRSGGGSNAELVVTQVRGCLNNIVNILDNAKLKAAEIAIPAVKNCLTACTIILTAGINVIPPSDESIPRLLDNTLEAFRDRDTTRTAIHCCRSLLMTSPKTQCDQEIVKYLLPRLITFVTTNIHSSDVELTQAQSGVCAVLTGFVGTMVGEQSVIAMALVVPTLLARAASERSRWRETAGRLLELVGIDQAGFRKVVSGMGARQRGFMEEVLKTGAAGDKSGQEEVKQQQGQPTIALKMNFGV